MVDGNDARNDEMTAVSVLSLQHDMDVTYSYRKDVAVDGNDYDKDERMSSMVVPRRRRWEQSPSWRYCPPSP